jgi:hypothetical protein
MFHVPVLLGAAAIATSAAIMNVIRCLLGATLTTLTTLSGAG